MKVSEDRYSSIRFVAWLANEFDSLRSQRLIVPLKVIGLQKQENPPASLIADPRSLPVGHRAGKK